MDTKTQLEIRIASVLGSTNGRVARKVLTNGVKAVMAIKGLLSRRHGRNKHKKSDGVGLKERLDCELMNVAHGVV